eukprot:1093256-Pleurochrysis_carterae.AAC.2
MQVLERVASAVHDGGGGALLDQQPQHLLAAAIDARLVEQARARRQRRIMAQHADRRVDRARALLTRHGLEELLRRLGGVGHHREAEERDAGLRAYP